jgi:hypothetical protein
MQALGVSLVKIVWPTPIYGVTPANPNGRRSVDVERFFFLKLCLNELSASSPPHSRREASIQVIVSRASNDHEYLDSMFSAALEQMQR